MKRLWIARVAHLVLVPGGFVVNRYGILHGAAVVASVGLLGACASDGGDAFGERSSATKRRADFEAQAMEAAKSDYDTYWESRKDPANPRDKCLEWLLTKPAFVYVRADTSRRAVCNYDISFYACEAKLPGRGLHIRPVAAMFGDRSLTQVILRIEHFRLGTGAFYFTTYRDAAHEAAGDVDETSEWDVMRNASFDPDDFGVPVRPEEERTLTLPLLTAKSDADEAPTVLQLFRLNELESIAPAIESSVRRQREFMEQQGTPAETIEAELAKLRKRLRTSTATRTAWPVQAFVHRDEPNAAP